MPVSYALVVSAPEFDRTAVPQILVVDDEAPVRRMLEKLLEGEGFEVAAAASGAEALTLANTCRFDTIILDIRMPGMDGIDLCARIRQIPLAEHVPVVFLTAVADRESQRRARLAGANDFLFKPLDDQVLLARVRTSVRASRRHDELETERDALRDRVEGRTLELRATVLQLEHLSQSSAGETIERLARAAEFRDDETAAHLQRMSLYCELLATKHGLDEETCQMLRVAAPMHDVGKIGIPDTVLLKPGRLTSNEFEVMKQHAEIGFQILSGSTSPLMKLAASVARTHHEKWDGSGYPDRTSGEAIPVEGRIAAIADVFDALTSERPYKRAWPLDDAIELLDKGRGRHFDPTLVNLFLGSMDHVLAIRDRYQETP